MRKFLLLLLILSYMLPAQAWLWDKKDKALEAELVGKGYAGKLPELNKNVQPKQKKVATPIFESQKGFNDPSELKPVPKDNPAFINIISKKDKTSKYVIDANEIIPLIERLADSIEEEHTVQLFVTRANILTMNLDHLKTKYDGQPESFYESFKKLMEINQFVKTVAQLRREAVTYQRYLAYQSTGSIYNPENINQQLQYLLEELNSAVILLKQEE
ncbi:hypothetical protein IJ384_05290 [bacterium]|nr:hypothetical protein [bacterium]